MEGPRWHVGWVSKGERALLGEHVKLVQRCEPKKELGSGYFFNLFFF